MFRVILLLLVALTLASSVSAQDRAGYGNSSYGICNGNCGYGPVPLVTGPPPPPCTNKLDFSVACNSQYAALGGIL